LKIDFDGAHSKLREKVHQQVGWKNVARKPPSK
jgi:hypothetical protein